jgi:tetratricopeptide (TPR) repeat protein
MTSTTPDLNVDAQVSLQKEYGAIIRSLTYTQGFGLFFVQCSPAEGTRLVAKLRQDLSQKRFEVLSLTEPIETLYDKIEEVYRNQPIDTLFVQGIEHSLYDYEKSRLWSDDALRLTYSETGVPRLLQHLNLSRERFRESFPINFVFLIPRFVFKYLARRAPDFLDWNSGIFEFSIDRARLRHESHLARSQRSRSIRQRFVQDNQQGFTLEECRKSLLVIQSLLEEPNQSEDCQADLLFEQARLFEISNEFEAAIAIYNKALQLRPNKDVGWYNRGISLSRLGRYEEAIASYNKALQLKTDDDIAWYKRGYALGSLGRYEEAIASFNEALKLKPDCDSAWYIRGYALGNLGRYEEAIASYDKALTLNPNDPRIFYSKACSYALQANLDDAIANLSYASELSPEKYREMAKTDSDLTVRPFLSKVVTLG